MLALLIKKKIFHVYISMWTVENNFSNKHNILNMCISPLSEEQHFLLYMILEAVFPLVRPCCYTRVLLFWRPYLGRPQDVDIDDSRVVTNRPEVCGSFTMWMFMLWGLHVGIQKAGKRRWRDVTLASRWCPLGHVFSSDVHASLFYCYGS